MNLHILIAERRKGKLEALRPKCKQLTLTKCFTIFLQTRKLKAHIWSFLLIEFYSLEGSEMRECKQIKDSLKSSPFVELNYKRKPGRSNKEAEKSRRIQFAWCLDLEENTTRLSSRRHFTFVSNTVELKARKLFVIKLNNGEVNLKCSSESPGELWLAEERKTLEQITSVEIKYQRAQCSCAVFRAIHHPADG